MATQAKPQLTSGELIALRGLRLPKVTLDGLRQSGIHCVSEVSIERQRSARQYVIRVQESGGAVAEMGVYCGYVSDTGSPLAWLQRLDSLGVNGVHARAVSPSVVRIQFVRVRHTYDLLISHHVLHFAENKQRPTLQNSILFLGRQGTLELDLWDKDKALAVAVSPVFYDRAGEAMTIPAAFTGAVRRAVMGVNCCGCRHVHLLEPPRTDVSTVPESTSGADSSLSNASPECQGDR